MYSRGAKGELFLKTMTLNKFFIVPFVKIYFKFAEKFTQLSFKTINFPYTIISVIKTIVKQSKSKIVNVQMKVNTQY